MTRERETKYCVKYWLTQEYSLSNNDVQSSGESKSAAATFAGAEKVDTGKSRHQRNKKFVTAKIGT